MDFHEIFVNVNWTRFLLFHVYTKIKGLVKVSLVQDACIKSFLVYLLKFEILQTTRKKQRKKHQNLLVKKWKLRVWGSLFHFFHAICKISNFDTWTARHLAQASFTELTLKVFCSQCGMHSVHLHGWNPSMRQFDPKANEQVWKFIKHFWDCWITSTVDTILKVV